MGKLVRGLLIVSVLGATLVRSAPADACACCAERGERIETSEPYTGYLLGEVARVRFAPTADLYSNAAWPENARGITDPVASYALAVTHDGKSFTMTLKTKDGRSGTLSFAPKKIESFFVDQHDTKPTGDPILYKELRFEAPVSATGIFATADAGSGPPLTTRLVLQGRGNVCTDASQFTHWSLSVSGKGVGYRFFGKLRTPAAPP